MCWICYSKCGKILVIIHCLYLQSGWGKVKLYLFDWLIELVLTATQQLWLYWAAPERGEGYIGMPRGKTDARDRPVNLPIQHTWLERSSLPKDTACMPQWRGSNPGTPDSQSSTLAYQALVLYNFYRFKINAQVNCNHCPSPTPPLQVRGSTGDSRGSAPYFDLPVGPAVTGKCGGFVWKKINSRVHVSKTV